MALALTGRVEAQEHLDPAPANATVDELGWMSGHWSGEESGVAMEEIWLAPKGGLMLGMHRDVFGEDRSFFEFLRIASTDSGVVYLAQPLGRPPTAFRLVSSSAGEVTFENPAHDFPQRIVYARSGDVLTARVEGVVDGARRAQVWEWKRSEGFPAGD